MSNAVWGGTANGDHHFGRAYHDAQLAAAGFQKPPPGPKAQSAQRRLRFNGGITAPRETRLERGDKLYRFTPSGPIDLVRQAAGCWWFDQDTCVFLWSRSKGSDDGFRRAARAAFSVLPEWGDMGNCIAGRLTLDYWAFIGNSARADGASGSLNNPYGFDVRQLYIPGGLAPQSFEDLRPVGLTRVKY